MTDFSFKTKPFAHQLEAFELSRDREAFALFAEQGTGKTKIMLDTAAYLYNLGRINTLLIIAPNGVHRNWIAREVPAHLPDYVPYRAATLNGGMSKKDLARFDELMAPGNFLRILAVNVEYLARADAAKRVERFVNATQAMAVVDESSRIKNPSAQRTKAVLALRKFLKYRRATTGTPVPNSPLDVFAQMMFLDPHVLPTQSFTAFRARYAVLLDDSSPLMKSIKAKSGRPFGPAIIARDKDGRPMFKNLEELDRILKPHSYRVLKRDCLDLPDKLYKRRPVEMSDEQARLYNELVRRLKKGTTDDSQRAVNRLASLTFLQQILGGWAPGAIMDIADPLEMPPGRPIFETPEANPRIATMLEDIEDFPDTSKFIIWSRFTYEIEAITMALRSVYGPHAVVAYYGAISKESRELAIDRFQGDPTCRFFVGNPQAGGTGLTLTAASTVIYFSNSFNLEHRLQSEDRAHRIGQTNKVLYIDYECEGTIDTKIIDALKAKKSVADLITGDAFNNWLE